MSDISVSNVLDLMIVGLMQNILENKHNFDHLSSKTKLNELKTLKLYMPRRFGHTYAGLHVPPKYFSNIYFLALNFRQKMYIKDSNRISDSITLFSEIKEMLINLRASERPIDCIVVDCSCFRSNSELDKIRDAYCECMPEKSALILLQ